MRLPLTLRLSYLYFGLRLAFLASSLFFSLVWFVMGFDSTIPEFYDSEKAGLGAHWSSVQTLFIFAYVSLINLNVGGLKSFKHLLSEVKLDLTGFIYPLRVRSLMSKRNSKVGAFRALCYSCAVALALMAVFEIPYVFLLNWFHFNDWFFPVYMFETDFLSFAFYRNFLLMIFPLLFGWWILFYPRFSQGWRAKYRFNLNSLYLLFILSGVWSLWIGYDTDIEPSTPESLGLDLDKNWTFPKQKEFPQNIYTYFDVPVGSYHTRDNQGGWHQYDWPVHAINVLAKYQVFISVGYLFMVRIEKDKRGLNRITNIK